MARRSRRRGPDIWLIVLGSASVAAWAGLAFSGAGLLLPAFCSPEAVRTAPFETLVELALVFNAPAKLVCNSALMIAAMMSPLIVGPLRHVHDRSFMRRRGRAMLLFGIGYAAIWLPAASALHAIALAATWAAPAPFAGVAATAAAILLWQASPAKQWCLNRCHRRPHLAAFGITAVWDALRFGLSHGASCAGACWALMLLPIIAASGHLPLMVAVMLFVAAERLERPGPLAWRWRWPRKALRIAVAQCRMGADPVIDRENYVRRLFSDHRAFARR